MRGLCVNVLKNETFSFQSSTAYRIKLTCKIDYAYLRHRDFFRFSWHDDNMLLTVEFKTFPLFLSRRNISSLSLCRMGDIRRILEQ